VRRSVERLHLGRGFVVSGKVALDEVAVPGQRPDLLDGFLLGDPKLRRAPGGKGDALWTLDTLDDKTVRAFFGDKRQDLAAKACASACLIARSLLVQITPTYKLS